MDRILTCIAICFLSVAAAADDHSGVAAEVPDAVTAFSAAYPENRGDDYFDYYADDADVFSPAHGYAYSTDPSPGDFAWWPRLVAARQQVLGG